MMDLIEQLKKELIEDMVFISSGSYSIGYDQYSLDVLYKDEILTNRIITDKKKTFKTQGFWLSRFPVTNRQFEIIIPKHVRSRYGDNPDHPVVDVTYYEVLKFCKLVGLRLPSEDEWEIAARGMDNKNVSNSDELDITKANFWPSEGLSLRGKYPPNTYGIYDMCGNMYDMTSTYLMANSGEEIIIIRGGSWGNCKYGSLVCMRAFSDPLIRNSRIGFRLCKDNNE